MNFLTEVKGFTPVIDVLTKEVGVMGAFIYGVVWRYCQADNGVCTASIETIASHGHLGRRTVERHLKELCDLGYLKDITPDLRNKPHTYADTGKAKILGTVEAQITTPESRSRKSRYVNLTQYGTSKSRMKKEEDTTTICDDFDEKAFGHLCTVYENSISTLSPLIAENIKDYMRQCSTKWIELAVKEAAENNVRKWVYIQRILDSWIANGAPTEKPEKDKKPTNGKASPGETFTDPVTGEVVRW